tara:strand:- start:346 stop:591 length:246 start_codon:yes stop_codon:yes gene_type:complete
MRIAKLKQIIVLAVNIVSPNRHQVRIGKTIKPAEDPMNLAVHAEPVASTIILYAYQKHTEVGMPIEIADNKALSFQNSEIN